MKKDEFQFGITHQKEQTTFQFQFGITRQKEQTTFQFHSFAMNGMNALNSQFLEDKT